MAIRPTQRSRTSGLANIRLRAGKLRAGWKDYPAQRRRLAAIPPGPPIFLTGPPRSGTTWLGAMLAASGIWHLHEPFGPWRGGRWTRSFEYRSSEVPDPEVDNFVAGLLAGGHREMLALPHCDDALLPLRLFGGPVRRILIKDPLACLLTEYLASRHHLQPLILFRHPAGFVSSMWRLGWSRGAFIAQLLADAPLMQAHLAHWRSLMEAHASEYSIASTAVLHAALTRVLWDLANAGVGRALIFEDLCQDPLPRLARLFDDLGLPYEDHVRAVHERACLGSDRPHDAYRTHEVNRNSIAMATAWHGELAARNLAVIRDIWERFDVPLYRDDADWRVP